jgi:D-inositol-3-phosphate glycosyltransferase
VVCGGPSGTGLEQPTSLHELARDLGIADVVRFEPPRDRAALAQWFRAADVTVVPSYSESFGLVAIESQACGTPVIASAVGGLRTAVAHNVSGILVDGHSPQAFAHAIRSLVTDPVRRAELSAGARMHAAAFGWADTTAGLLNTYRSALANAHDGRLRLAQ